MKRRLYFLIPNTGHARAMVNDLEGTGIKTAAMHVLAKPGIDLNGLPLATGRQRMDAGARIETILWDGNLAIYFVALFALIAMVYMRIDWYWLLLPAAVMLLTFVMGIVFTSQGPNVHPVRNPRCHTPRTSPVDDRRPAMAGEPRRDADTHASPGGHCRRRGLAYRCPAHLAGVHEPRGMFVTRSQQHEAVPP